MKNLKSKLIPAYAEYLSTWLWNPQVTESLLDKLTEDDAEKILKQLSFKPGCINFPERDRLRVLHGVSIVGTAKSSCAVTVPIFADSDRCVLNMQLNAFGGSVRWHSIVSEKIIITDGCKALINNIRRIKDIQTTLSLTDMNSNYATIINITGGTAPELPIYMPAFYSWPGRLGRKSRYIRRNP